MGGSGSIREREPGVFELTVFIGRDPLTAKRRTRTKVFRGSKADAAKAMAALQTEIGEERPSTAGPATTVGQLLDRWMELAEPDLSPTTVREYRRLINQRIRPALGTVVLRRLQTSMLDDFYRALSTKAGLSSGSVHQIHSILRRALKQAVKWSWLMSNPAVNATPPRVRHSEIRPPSTDDVRNILAAASNHDPVVAIALRLAATTGMRRGEICGLRWTAVDLRAAVIHVNGAVATTKGGWIEKDTKTHQSRRISIDASTVEALRAHQHWAADLANHAGAERRGDGFVASFVVDGSEPMHPDSLTAAFGRLARSLGIADVRLHDLRHAHATALLAAGVPIKSVSSRLGHADASTTLNVYAHALESTDRQAADLIGQMYS